ncbi:MAG: hypothetical protein JXB85_00500 [Anaerolineales bacterium]|nr:hypothetical protein [Anaerolineales bacterium]
MNENPTRTFQPYAGAALILFLLGWGGVAVMIFGSRPIPPAQWAFFVFWTMALTGTALPATWFLNLRFPSDPPAEAFVIVRQALWFGVYGAVLAWLEKTTVLTIWVALGWGLGLIAIEYIIRMRERSRWRPSLPVPEPTQETAGENEKKGIDPAARSPGE